MTLAQRTFAEVEIRRARATDPLTSKTAARRSHRLAAQHFARILRVLRDSAEPLSAEQIAALADLEPLQVSRRMAELCGPDLAAAEVADQLGRTRSGRAASRWRSLA